MERLKNKEILVGREPEKGRLMIAVDVNGQHKAVVLGEFKSVPDGVSRCKPAEGTAHCKIAVDVNGSITVTNLKPANCTYVNNQGVATKGGIKTDAQLQLGAEKYPVSVNAIVEAAKKLLPAPVKEYSISHLEEVWEEYSKAIERERRISNLFNSIRGLLTLLAIVLGSIGGGVVRTVLYVVAVLMALYLFYDILTGRADKKKNRIQLNFENKYVCPHCKRYLNGGAFQPYRRLHENVACPYCHSKWTDK